MLKFLLICVFGLMTQAPSLSAESCCRLDIAPAALRIDVLEHGNTVHRVNLFALRLEGCYQIYKGFNIKPVLLMGPRAINNSSLFSGGLAFGHFIPLGERFCLNPNVGVTYTNFHTTVTYELFPFDISLRERFRSVSPFVGLDATFYITSCWRIYGSFQYAWSRTHTTVESLFSSKDNSKGANWGLVLERDLTKEWSINAGLGYNLSMNREKHGIRVFGGKIGVSRWY